jgi:hypothetical protein
MSVIMPVGVGLLPPPLTVSATVNDCAVVMLLEPGITVTVGVISAGAVTVTTAVPEAPL